MNCSARVLTCLALAALQGPSWAQSRWQPEVFPISYWVGPQVDYNNLEAWQTVKDCNFTVAGPACWSKRPADLVAENRKMMDLCGQVGLKAIVVDGRLAWTLPQEDNWKDKVAQVVADYGSHPALFGYFLQDEPNLEQFEGLGSESMAETARAALPPLGVLVLAQLAMIPIGGLFNALLAFGEEVGWRGWLLPALRPLGVWPALLTSGAIWGLWHSPLILLGYNFGLTDWRGVAVMTIDPANLSLLYQGLPPDFDPKLSYGRLPYQLGLLRREVLPVKRPQQIPTPAKHAPGEK